MAFVIVLNILWNALSSSKLSATCKWCMISLMLLPRYEMSMKEHTSPACPIAFSTFFIFIWQRAKNRKQFLKLKTSFTSPLPPTPPPKKKTTNKKTTKNKQQQQKQQKKTLDIITKVVSLMLWMLLKMTNFARLLGMKAQKVTVAHCHLRWPITAIPCINFAGMSSFPPLC